MNNPFLSDRNIFSKVVNPLKKKSENQAKDAKPSQLPKKPVPKQPYISTTPLTRPQQSQKRPFESGIKKIHPEPKMSFGKPLEQDNRISFNKNSMTNKGEAIVPPRQFERQLEYGIDSFKTTENQSNNYSKNNYKSISLDQNFEFRSPAQDEKFQEYRKTHNFKDYSPINNLPEKKLNDSQFLNIDAIGDDLDKFLAGSKNQEELCQLLGITRKGHSDSTVPQKRQQKQYYEEKRPERGQFEEKREPERQNVERQVRGRKQEQMGFQFGKNEGREYIPERARIEKRQSEPYPSGFLKQKQQREAPYYPQIQPNQQEKQYIPTFNYVDLDHQNETISREQQVPRFNQIRQSRKKELQQSSKDNLQVFDYSQVNNHQGDKTIQDMITQQMNSLSINGKYRTFLSCNEKIVTVKYKLRPL